MDCTGEQLHPNWRALATVHIPLKRFIKEKTEQPQNKTDCFIEKSEISGLKGDEIKVFYQKLLKRNEDEQKHFMQDTEPKVANKCILHKPTDKNEFETKKYFHFAMGNKVNELKKMNIDGQNVNVCDFYGWSALMMASCEGAYETVEFLLTIGANRFLKDKTGKTAKDLALNKGHHSIVDLLMKIHLGTKDYIQEQKTEISEPFYCQTCEQSFKETSKNQHFTSTLHQFNTKSSLPINKLQKFNISSRNKGLQLMVKQGWDKESGLGPSQSGRLYPVKTVIRKQRTGLGIMQEAARVTHFEPYDRKAVQRHTSDYYKKKQRNRNDIKREKKRTSMAKSSDQKCMEILKSTEEVADKVLANKQELINLDRRRQQNREAIRELEKNPEEQEKKVWTTIGSMLVKLNRLKALELLKKDQIQIEREINILQSEQKILVNKHRDLEHFSPYSGTNIKPLDRKEFNALRANLPIM